MINQAAGMSGSAERMRVLQMIDDGQVSAAEGLRLLDAAVPGHTDGNPDLAYWRRWWMVPMWAGIGVLLLGATFMFAAYQAGGFGFWLHVRVRTNQQANDWPCNIALSFPLPIRLTAWLLRLCGRFIPQHKDHGLDEVILALAETTSSDAPLYVDVDEGEGGERVQVYIG